MNTDMRGRLCLRAYLEGYAQGRAGRTGALGRRELRRRAIAYSSEHPAIGQMPIATFFRALDEMLDVVLPSQAAGQAASRGDRP